jgi:hypothetical protein
MSIMSLFSIKSVEAALQYRAESPRHWLGVPVKPDESCWL